MKDIVKKQSEFEVIMEDHFGSDFYPDWLEKYNLNIISVQDLIPGVIYGGTCRNSNEALWDGQEFHYIRSGYFKEDIYIEKIKHKEQETNTHVDYFTPIVELTEVLESEKLFFKDNGLVLRSENL